jgi:hypothetical protein
MAKRKLSGRIISEELAGAFKDKRLDARLGTIVTAMAKNPEGSFPSVCTSGELEGLYRFMSNVHVTPDAILSPHYARTRARASAEARVLVVHDSTDFSFKPDGKRKGLGRRIKTDQTFFAHFSLVLAADGSRRPLGLAAMAPWVRPEEPDGTGRERWLAQMIATQRSLDLGTRCIHVCDREADDYAMFTHLVESDTRFVIRAKNNRQLIDQFGEVGTIRSILTTCEEIVGRSAPIAFRRAEHSTIKAKLHPARNARVARLSAATASLSLRRPQGYERKYAHRGPVPTELPINVVRVWEENPPEGCEPVEWFLFTNEPVSTAEEALDIIDVYRARWVIEEYFKVLKTGCAYESRQLEEYESLLNALAVTIPIAYESLRLRTLARITPDAPALSVVTPTQLQVLRKMGRRPLPPNPNARDVLLSVAALGGHIKYAPDPGWLTIYRGFQKLELLAEGWAAAAAEFQCHSDQ